MNRKIQFIRQKLNETNIDGILITSPVNHRYLTNFDNADGCLLITKNSSYAFEDFRYYEVAKSLLSDFYTVIQPEGKRSKWLGEIIKSENIKNLGIENFYVTLRDFEKLKSDLNISFTSIGSLISDMREVKTEYEISQIKEAQKITDDAFSYILDFLSSNSNLTENDVSCELEYYMRKHGAQDKSFETIVANAENSSLPHAVPSNAKLKNGFLTMDFGAVVNGYHSDMTRTVCIGRASDEMKKVYSTVLDAQLKALEFINEEKNCKDVDGIAREIIYKEYKGCFGHSLGHGVGLEIHEEPRLSPNFDKILVAGNVVTVEPGIYIEKNYGCRIEDMIIIMKGQIENITKSPKNLIEI